MANIELLEEALPVAPLKIVALGELPGTWTKSQRLYRMLSARTRANDSLNSPLYLQLSDGQLSCWIASCPRFGTGEAKGVLNESIRGKDLFIMVDVCNYSLTYTVNGHVNHMSPDDHYPGS